MFETIKIENLLKKFPKFYYNNFFKMAAVNSFINSQKRDLYLNLGNELLQQAKSMVDFRTEHYNIMLLHQFKF